jgi:hypothetical protein
MELKFQAQRSLASGVLQRKKTFMGESLIFYVAKRPSPPIEAVMMDTQPRVYEKTEEDAEDSK